MRLAASRAFMRPRPFSQGEGERGGGRDWGASSAPRGEKKLETPLLLAPCNSPVVFLLEVNLVE